MLLCLLCALLSSGESFPLDGHIQHFVVTRGAVFASTERSLYQLRPNLTLERRVSLRGVRSETNGFQRVPDGVSWNSTLSVTVLLPFVSNNTLVLCGVLDNTCGHCEILSLQDVSEAIHVEGVLVGPISHDNASVAFLVNESRPGQEETYILTAAGKRVLENTPCDMKQEDSLYLSNTLDNVTGGILSLSANERLRPRNENLNVSFVDGFQVGSYIYLFSNVRSSPGFVTRLIWLNTEHKEKTHRKDDTLSTLRGATLNTGSHSELLASSVINNNVPLLWSGVFGVHGSRVSRELLLFDISPNTSVQVNTDPVFSLSKHNPVEKPPTITPLRSLLNQSHMNSVLALKHRAWQLFFIGTEDGQVFKLVVDKNYEPGCPKVLYRADTDNVVFPKLHLSQVDHKHVYVAFPTQIMMIPVSKCSTYTTLRACWSSQDPQCVWCDFSQSCVFVHDCKNSSWVSVSEDFQQEKMVSFKTDRNSSGQITIIVQVHVSTGPGNPKSFSCHFSVRCGHSPAPNFPLCICVLDSSLPADGPGATVHMTLGKNVWSENLNLRNCSAITGPTSPALCKECLAAGCGWSLGTCTWENEAPAKESVCEMMDSSIKYMKPVVSSVNPKVVSFYGRNHALLLGHNFSHVTHVRIRGESDCRLLESPVWNITNESLTFHIPSVDNKGVVQVCAVLPDNSCHGDASVTYRSLPSCADVKPSHVWVSGGRTVTLVGTRMDFVESVFQSHFPQRTLTLSSLNPQTLTYNSPPAENPLSSVVFLRVANHTLNCSKHLTYLPDPVFTKYTAIRTGDDAWITIQKTTDDLKISPKELTVWAVIQGREYPCVMEIEGAASNETDLYTCEIRNLPNAEFQHLKIIVGDATVVLRPKSSYLFLILLVLLLIPCIVVVVLVVYKKKQRQLNTRVNILIESIEIGIRNDIRQGFIDLQTENADLLENVGTIPFLNYKHFAAKIFFPESEALMKSCVKDISQDGVMVQLDEGCQSLSRLIRDQQFLTSMVHVLEEQRSFSIKDKCTLASLLTVVLHSDLTYLTEVMEVLLRDLMQKSGQSQPKLLLRRTESTVEKLLTNWTSICLYGFLRESVGQPLFLLVSALSQQISKGPVDCVTGKALYTLSEDWLLSQAQDFQPLRLEVLFAVGSDGELSEPLEVTALSCDTVDQLKDKILAAFRNKFGFPYNTPVRELVIEYVRGNASLRLEEVDLSSERLGDVTMLNTMKHYKIPDGATIKVLSRKNHLLSPQGSVKDDQDFSGKYFHLIDPDIVEDLKNPERKKLKFKEVHLTKLLSTKVAVHSFVEKLFKCIWGLQQSRAPLSVKHFFDFLDAQAEEMKITDPDVLHIWKTNSLPLRFWVNILKNPQFVFDLEKSPHLDGCLSVVAQAFMDSFSLSDVQLGKYTPTNKLLYGKEIPQYKREVAAYYKCIQDQSPVTESEFRRFLQNESKKHEHEFNEAAALRELHKFIQRYFTEIQEKLVQTGAPSGLKEQLHHIRKCFDEQKSCSWN